MRHQQYIAWTASGPDLAAARHNARLARLEVDGFPRRPARL